MQVQPYLFFDGRCAEALDFYKSAIGAQVEMLMRFKDSPEPPDPEKCAGSGPVDPEAVMHASFRVGDTVIMASDGMCSGKPEFEGISLAISVKDGTEAQRIFQAVAAGGQVQMPLDKTFFSPAFGMVQDKFGVHWMIVADQAGEQRAAA